MSYSSVFRTRMHARGGNNKDRELHNAIRSFEQWFRSDLRREEVQIQNPNSDWYRCEAIFQDINQGNSGEKADNKYMITPRDVNTEGGSYIRWRGEDWMIFSDEVKTIPSHNQSMVHQLNERVKWTVDGKICGNGRGRRAYVRNDTLYTLGVSMSGHNAWLANSRMTMFLQNNEESLAIKTGDRVVMNMGVYRVMFRDVVSRNGIVSFLLEQDFVAHDRDDLELGMADVPPTIEEAPSEDFEINGIDKLKIGTSTTFTSTEPVTEWIIDDINGAITVVEQNETSIDIYAPSNFKKVGSIVNIVAKTSSGAISSKTINIVSPY